MTALNLLKMLIDDFVRYRWRDLVALSLLGMGLWILMHSQDPGARDEAKAIIGAGLIMLDPRGLLPGQSSNGNGHTAPAAPPAVLPTSAKAAVTGPPGPRLGEPGGSDAGAQPAGWGTS